MSVYACIAHYADLDATVAAVTSLAAGSVAPERLCVVDNQGDLEGAAADRLRSVAGVMALEIVRPGRNIGFAGAGWLLLVNNDAELEPGCLAALLAAADAFPRAALFGPLIAERDDGALWFAGGLVDWDRLAVDHERAQRDEAPYRSDFVTGCVLLARMGAVEECGPLDEKLFMYFEDVEWAWRLLGRGWTTLVVPSARARHSIARRGRRRVFSPAAVYLMTRNRLLVGRLVGHLIASARTSLWWALRQIAKSGSAAELAAAATAAGWGLHDGLRGRAGPPPAGLQAALRRASNLGVASKAT